MASLKLFLSSKYTGGIEWNFDSSCSRAAAQSHAHGRTWFVFGMEPKWGTFPPEISSAKGYAMVPYFTLTDDEWTLIQKILPVPKRGPKRPHDRAVCAAFLFCEAAGVSIESLPVGQFPDS